MKATGEVMSICRTFESALLKALTSVEIKCDGLRIPFVTNLDDEKLMEKLAACDDERIFCVAEALRRELIDVEGLYLAFCASTAGSSTRLKGSLTWKGRFKTQPLTKELLYEAESRGFTDSEILGLSGVPREVLQDIRIYNDIFPVYKMVDTCGGEFDAATPYYYSCYDAEDEVEVSDEEKNSGHRFGTDSESARGSNCDYCCVQGVWAIKDLGYEAIIMNNNPETVSTDFDTSDKLYFESSFHIDNVMNVIKKGTPLRCHPPIRRSDIAESGGRSSTAGASTFWERPINISTWQRIGKSSAICWMSWVSLFPRDWQ